MAKTTEEFTPGITEGGRPTRAEEERHSRLIDATDKQIDVLVYEVYGLTEEEIRTVAGA